MILVNLNLPPQKTRREMKNEIKMLNSKLNQYEELLEARNNDIADLKKQIRQLNIESNKNDLTWATVVHPILQGKETWFHCFEIQWGLPPILKLIYALVFSSWNHCVEGVAIAKLSAFWKIWRSSFQMIWLILDLRLAWIRSIRFLLNFHC